MNSHSTVESRLPEQPIQRIVAPLERFMHVETAGGIVLLAATLVALVLANTGASDWFLGLWQTRIGIALTDPATGAAWLDMNHSLKHWISDGLMGLFFFVIGLEVKRELVLGELRDLRGATLPIAAAIGGMMVPAAIYLALPVGDDAAAGWGIPMTTDIAFLVGCLAILGRRVPPALRVTLVSIAIVDDIGAILVIAFGYTEHVDLGWLVAAFVGIAVVAIMTRLGVRGFGSYVVVGSFVWLAFHESGVHATLAGVILGLQTPAKPLLDSGFLRSHIGRAFDLLQGSGWAAFRDRAATLKQFRYELRESVAPLEYLETSLHPWVSFAIIPLFALCNAGVKITPDAFVDPVALAIGAGLLLGKPLGILTAGFVAVKIGIARLPAGLTWTALGGASILTAIGFTMALFIAGLALEGAVVEVAKVGILGASAIAAVAGVLVLRAILPLPGVSSTQT